jgi:uncharacterized membrane protein
MGEASVTRMGDEMADYSRSMTIDADPDELFGYLSDVENLPKYFTRMTEAHPESEGEVRVTARLEPQDTGGAPKTVESDATFEVDQERRALRWGSENEHDYHGELRVEPAGDGSSVSVTLHTEHEDDDIDAGIEETLRNIAGQVGRE